METKLTREQIAAIDLNDQIRIRPCNPLPNVRFVHLADISYVHLGGLGDVRIGSKTVELTAADAAALLFLLIDLNDELPS